MAKESASGKPFGYRWRSSRPFIVTVISVAMFADTFLFSFIIPILPVILEERIHLSPSKTQTITSVILAMNALVSIIIAPFTGRLADNIPSKNGMMILSWAVNVVGTVITAWSTTLAGLFLGRLIQTFAGSLIFIVGMAILGDTVGSNHLGKTLGFTILFVSAGLLSGPAVSGFLWEYTSYSGTWSSTFVILLFGLILQFLMVVPFDNHISDVKSPPTDEETPQAQDTSPLLSPESTAYTYQSLPSHESTKESPATTSNVYSMMLRKKRVATALLADVLFAMVIASFETTIPIHIKTVFHWETLQAGLLFLLLQAPSLVLVVPAGWLKDKIGMRWPVTVGFLCLAPSLWLLGVPGEDGFKWANEGETGPIIYIFTLIAIGVWRTLLLGFGCVEVLNGANELSAEYPGIFGPNGGYSRSFSMSNISWKLGMFLGPLVSGGLTELVGYYYLNVFLGTLCLMMGISTFLLAR